MSINKLYDISDLTIVLTDENNKTYSIVFPDMYHYDADWYKIIVTNETCSKNINYCSHVLIPLVFCDVYLKDDYKNFCKYSRDNSYLYIEISMFYELFVSFLYNSIEIFVIKNFTFGICKNINNKQFIDRYINNFSINRYILKHDEFTKSYVIPLNNLYHDNTSFTIDDISIINTFKFLFSSCKISICTINLRFLKGRVISYDILNSCISDYVFKYNVKIRERMMESKSCDGPINMVLSVLVIKQKLSKPVLPAKINIVDNTDFMTSITFDNSYKNIFNVNKKFTYELNNFDIIETLLIVDFNLITEWHKITLNTLKKLSFVPIDIFIPPNTNIENYIFNVKNLDKLYIKNHDGWNLIRINNSYVEIINNSQNDNNSDCVYFRKYKEYEKILKIHTIEMFKSKLNNLSDLLKDNKEYEEYRTSFLQCLRCNFPTRKFYLEHFENKAIVLNNYYSSCNNMFTREDNAKIILYLKNNASREFYLVNTVVTIIYGKICHYGVLDKLNYSYDMSTIMDTKISKIMYSKMVLSILVLKKND